MLALPVCPVQLNQWAPSSGRNSVSKYMVEGDWGRHPLPTSGLCLHGSTHPHYNSHRGAIQLSTQAENSWPWHSWHFALGNSFRLNNFHNRGWRRAVILPCRILDRVLAWTHQTSLRSDKSNQCTLQTLWKGVGATVPANGNFSSGKNMLFSRDQSSQGDAQAGPNRSW